MKREHLIRYIVKRWGFKEKKVVRKCARLESQIEKNILDISKIIKELSHAISQSSKCSQRKSKTIDKAELFIDTLTLFKNNIGPENIKTIFLNYQSFMKLLEVENKFLKKYLAEIDYLGKSPFEEKIYILSAPVKQEKKIDIVKLKQLDTSEKFVSYNEALEIDISLLDFLFEEICYEKEHKEHFVSIEKVKSTIKVLNYLYMLLEEGFDESFKDFFDISGSKSVSSYDYSYESMPHLVPVSVSVD